MFHITTLPQWEAAQSSGEYLPPDFLREGFIHCSYERQIERTVKKHFAGQTGLILLEIDRDSVPSPVVDENLSGGAELFPHIYGPLPVAAVRAVLPYDP